jgi:hypothetical protein
LKKTIFFGRGRKIIVLKAVKTVHIPDQKGITLSKKQAESKGTFFLNHAPIIQNIQPAVKH